LYSPRPARRTKLESSLTRWWTAACVNVVPQIESVYRWQGKVERAGEWLLIIKTQAAAFEGVRATIEALHSYEVPECVLLEVHAGSRDYLDWIAANVD
jgi:periplasmic divalent cation tolerance protein